MKTHGQYCPIAKAVEVLGERWSLLVVRELLIGSSHFNDIARGLPVMSRTMLSKRLRQLEAAGLVERLDGEYELTPAGAELRPIVFGLGDWCARWILEDPTADECDTEVLMWWAHSRLDTSELPDRRVVLKFTFSDDGRIYWVVAEEMGCSVCLHDPGFDVDAVIATDSITLHKIFYGRESLRDALRADRLQFDGANAIIRRLPKVLALMPPDVMGVTASSPQPQMFEGGVIGR